MAKYYDIDTSVRINGGLIVNGDISIPSNSLSVGGVLSGNQIKGDGSGITNLSSSAMTDVLKLDGTRSMTGTLVMSDNQIRLRGSSDANHIVGFTATSINGEDVNGPRVAGYNGVEIAKIGTAPKTLARFYDGNIMMNTTVSVSGNINITGTVDGVEVSVLKTDFDNLSGNYATHNHDGRYYTETEVNNLLSGKSDTNHTHNYDNYQYWTLQANGANGSNVLSTSIVDIKSSGATSLSKSGNTITISSTDTNTWRPIDDTPTSGSTTTSISSNWAYNHNSGTGVGKHIPTGGTTSTFLRGDGTWASVSTTDTNNYLTSVSGNGNGTVTFKREGLTDLTWNAGHTHSDYVKNNATNQSVESGFTAKGTMYIGVNTGSGVAIVRTGTGGAGIQLAGDNGAKLSGVGSYIKADGNAEFSGQVKANSLNITSTSMVTNLNSEMIGGKKEKELAKNLSVFDLGGKGVHSGMAVEAQAVPNMTVKVRAGTVYTDTGMRIAHVDTDLAISNASTTYDRKDVVYIKGSSASANEGELGVATGTPSATPAQPSIPSDAVKLAVLYIPVNSGSIQSSQITDARQYRQLRRYDNNSIIVDSTLSVKNISSFGSTVDILKPVRNSKTNISVTFSTNTESITWNHGNNAGTNYVVRLSCNSPEPHIYWSDKLSNSITINRDDVCETDIIVDVSIEYY